MPPLSSNANRVSKIENNNLKISVGIPEMNKDDQDYLAASFSDQINYGPNVPLRPINPITYLTPEGDTCLHIAAIRGDLRLVKILVEAGLDVNFIGDMGYTPLHYASKGKHQKVVDFLLRAGAQPDIKNEFGQKALE
ncbi:MAG: ankyrin repeat domain-containing protein [Alphaproteobacteria bacterium]|nr:ankyrin repeat domain-containing protein [Alphaproteobacteria bacterium]